MTVRAKFTVTSITEYSWGSGRRVTLSPVYDPALPEDRRYAKATPSGEIWMQVDNPTALGVLALGTAFYVEFTPVEPVPGVPA